MPPSPAVQKILRQKRNRRRRLSESGVLERAGQLAASDAESRRGILQRIGDAFEAIDAPFRSFIVGEGFKGLTAAEFNSKLGIEPTEKGKFPAKELATELLVSPLNFVAGVGSLTKAGRLAARAGKLKTAIAGEKITKAANLPIKIAGGVAGRKFTAGAGDTAKSLGAKLAEINAQLKNLGAPEELQKGLLAQFKTGQRGLVNVGIPFTGGAAKLPFLGIPETVVGGGLDIAGKAFGKTSVAKGLRNAFQRTPKGAAGDLFKLQREGARGIRAAEEIVLEIIEKDIFGKVDLTTPLKREEFFTLAENVSRYDELNDFVKANLFEPTELIPGIQRKLSDRSMLRDELARFGGANRDAADKLVEINKLVTGEQIAAFGRGAGQLTDESVGYVRRLITSGGLDFVEKRGLGTALDDIIAATNKAEGVGTFESTQLARNAQLRNVHTAKINEWARTKGFKGEFFDLDAPKVLAKTLTQKSLSTMNAEVAQAFIKAHGVTGTIEGGIPLARFIAENGLFGLSQDVVTKLGGLSKKGGITFAKRLDELTPDRIQKTLDAAGLGLTGIPADVAELFTRQLKPALDPFGQSGIVRLWDVTNRVMANALTNVFPAFHLRNGIGNATQMMMAGMRPDEIPVFITKLMALKRVNPDEIARLGQIGALQKRAGQAAALIDDAEAVRGVSKFSKGAAKVGDVFAKPFKFGGKVGSKIENGMRGALFLWARDKKGLSEFEAVQLVNKHLFDYNTLTNFEKNIANRVLFFYRWTSNAIPWLVQSAFENPKVFRLMSQASSGAGVTDTADPGVPSFVREKGFLPFGETKEGKRQIISGLGLPIEELRKLDLFAKKPPGEGIVGTPLSLLQSALQKAGEVAVPPLKSAFELIAERDFFLDRPIVELDKAPPILRRLPAAVTKTLLGFEVEKTRTGKDSFRMNPLTSWVIRNSPLSRFVSTAGKFDDPRREEVIAGLSGEALIQLLSGVRVSSFDEAKEILKNARRALDSDLKEDQVRNNVNFFTRAFVPSDRKKSGKADDEVLMRVQLLSDISKVQKNIADGEARQSALQASQPAVRTQ